ncbi:hypothetical protein [Neobacillus cucumis]|uniref:hypothetical protein n=1 Tax=Neobacillus cucumis TaxID=1740721 RepID=UPI0019637612|nr:hypothetical protein [Neobacillus cucumis]MBM7652650.1 hypothetical protein [Neobacillus cucumis]
MAKSYAEPTNMEEAGMKGDDALYKNEQTSGNDEKELKQKYGHRVDDLPVMDGQNAQARNQEQFRRNGQSSESQTCQEDERNQNGQDGNGQRERGEQGLHLSGYNIAKSDGRDLQQEGSEELRKKNGDSHPEKQVNEFYQRYGQDDPLDKQI